MGFFSKVFNFLKSTASLITTAVAVVLLFFPGTQPFGVALLISTGIGALVAGFSPEPQDISVDLTTRVRETLAPSLHLYGETATAGSFVYSAEQNDKVLNIFDNEDEKTYISSVRALAPHEVEAIEIYSIDGYIYTDDDEDNENRKAKIRFEYRLGTEDQEAFQTLPEEWTSAHQGKGIADVCIHIEEDFEVFPIFPHCIFLVKGKKIKIPGTETLTYTDNAVAVIRNVIETLPQIITDEDSFDEDLFKQEYDKAEIPWLYEREDDTVVDKKWSINGAINLNLTPQSIMRGLRDQIAGIVEEYRGKWIIKVGDWDPITQTNLTDANLLSHIGITPLEAVRLRYNTIKGTYQGKETNFQRTDFTPVVYDTLVEREGGKRIAVDMRLNLIKYQALAQRIAHLQIRKVNWRRGILNGFFDYEATKDLTIGDHVTYDDVLLPDEPDNIYQIIGIQLRAVEGGVGNQIILKHTAQEIYDTPYDITKRPSLPGTTPPGTGISSSPHLLIKDTFELGDPETIQFLFTITVGNYFVSTSRIELQYKKTTSEDWINIATSGYGTYHQPDVYTGVRTYDFRVRAQTLTGGFTPWNTVVYDVVSNLPDAPEIRNMSCEVVGATVFIAWEIEPSPYLSYIQLKHTTEALESIDDATWNTMLDSVKQIGRPATSTTITSAAGTYAIRAYNRLHEPLSTILSCQIDQEDVDDGSFEPLRNDIIVPLNESPTIKEGAYDYARDLDYDVRVRNLVPTNNRYIYLDNPRPQARGDIIVSYEGLELGSSNRVRLEYELEGVNETQDVNQTFTIQTAKDINGPYSSYTGATLFNASTLHIKITLKNAILGSSPPTIKTLTVHLERAP